MSTQYWHRWVDGFFFVANHQLPKGSTMNVTSALHDCRVGKIPGIHVRLTQEGQLFVAQIGPQPATLDDKTWANALTSVLGRELASTALAAHRQAVATNWQMVELGEDPPTWIELHKMYQPKSETVKSGQFL